MEVVERNMWEKKGLEKSGRNSMWQVPNAKPRSLNLTPRALGSLRKHITSSGSRTCKSVWVRTMCVPSVTVKLCERAYV